MSEQELLQRIKRLEARLDEIQGARGLIYTPGVMRINAQIQASEAVGARAYNTGTPTINSSTVTPLTFDTELFDTDNMFTAGDSKFYAIHSGYYSAGGSVEMANTQNTAASRFGMWARKNGTTYVGGNGMHTKANEYADIGVTSGMFWMDAGDYIEICFYHTEGVSKTLMAASSTNQHLQSGWIQRVA